MGRLILTMHVSADGYIAQPDKGLWPDFGWPPVVQGRLNDVYREAGSVLYGRGIYEAVVPWWSAVARGATPSDVDVGQEGEEFAQLLAALPKAVVSSTMPEPGDGTRVIRNEVMRQITELVQAEAKDVVLLAGGRLTGELLTTGLLKEIVLIVGHRAHRRRATVGGRRRRAGVLRARRSRAFPTDHQLAALPRLMSA